MDIPSKYEDDNRKHERIRKNNLLAIKDLAISVQDNISFRIVSNAKNVMKSGYDLRIGTRKHLSETN